MTDAHVQEQVPLLEQELGDAARRRRQSMAQERAVERSEIRAAVVRFLLVGLVTLAVVAVPSALVMRHLVRVHTLEDLKEATVSTAQTTVAPLVDADLLAGEPEALALLDRMVDGRIRDGSMLRLTIWDRSGLVIYSDAAGLVGRHFPEHDWTDTVLVDGLAVASFEDDGDPQNRYEHDDGHYVEVDVPFTSPGGADLILEIYYPSQIVHDQQGELLLRLLPVGLLTLLVLQLAQLPLAARLAGRIQRLQLGRRNLMRQAAAASDVERRRIARDLHDEVIQELAGASYALEAVANRLDPEMRPAVDRSRAVVRSSVTRLRTMLGEIYPADLDALGLPEALDRLADRLRADGVQVRVDVPAGTALDRTSATLLYRVAREALTNALKHARAEAVLVRLVRQGSTVVLEVADDGVGFAGPRQPVVPSDPGAHVGLHLIADTVAEVGGTVDVTSTPGVGTRVVATITLPAQHG